jgi:hypothetical protein
MPENWLMKQLFDEPNMVYEVGFIREKGKAIARAMQQSPKTGSCGVWTLTSHLTCGFLVL